MAVLERRVETDIALRLEWRKYKERLPAFMRTRMEGGSSFITANTLRHFFLEYFNRMMQYGPHVFPCSFNVMESFLVFSEDFIAFDLRNEREHLLRLYEYLDWYTGGNFPAKPAVLTDILPEGVVYSYNLVGPEDFTLNTPDSVMALLGVSFVRHSNELSAMLIAGESPAFLPDDELASGLSELHSRDNRVEPDKSLLITDRYLPDLPGYARVILLTRFDIQANQFDVRYLHLDTGPAYLVLTDDAAALSPLGNGKERLMELMPQRLARYESLFSALAFMIYLPAFFISEQKTFIDSEFITELHRRRHTKRVRNAILSLGRSAVPLSRTVRCLISEAPITETMEHTVKPPDLRFKSSGYWRPLNAGEIGEDKAGNPIVGKTWVERRESWSASSPQAFILRKARRTITGPDPGSLYVVRSPSHDRDIYKIGSSRREVQNRAAELSVTSGVPLPFNVLAQWECGNCAAVEREVHKRLSRYRLNKRREFFWANLPMIISTIQEVVAQFGER
jgi:hypothetical protein